MERHEGKPIAHLKVNEGLKALRDAVEEFGPTHNFTKLVPGLDGSDPGPHAGPALLVTLSCLRCAVGIVWTAHSRRLPLVRADDAFSSIPYEKGMAFLWYLQKTVGGDEPMEEFLVAYIKFFREPIKASPSTALSGSMRSLALATSISCWARLINKNAATAAGCVP